MSHQTDTHQKRKERQKQNQQKALVKQQKRKLQQEIKGTKTSKRAKGRTFTPGFTIFETDAGFEIDNIPQLRTRASVPILFAALYLVIVIWGETFNLNQWVNALILLVLLGFATAPFLSRVRLQVDKTHDLISVKHTFLQRHRDLVVKRKDVTEFAERPSEKSGKEVTLVACMNSKETHQLLKVPEPQAVKTLVELLRAS